jgi:hypothetical protein
MSIQIQQAEQRQPELGYDHDHVAPANLAREIVHDCVFLGVSVLLSLILYVQYLGFYSDDWAFLMLLNTSSDQSFSGLCKALYLGDVVIRQRPTQVLYLAGLYWLFGLHPLGYHLANAAMLLWSTLLFYLVLRELQQPRPFALVLPLVYMLLPHYSTDRFWVAAFQATLSIALYFLSLYADLRMLRDRLAHRWGWKLLGVLSLLGSGLSYEVTLPLFLLINPFLIWYRARQIYGPDLGKPFMRANRAVLLGCNLIALAGVVVYKALVTVRVNVEIDFVSHIIGLVTGAFRVSYGSYGIGLPYIVWWILRNNPDWMMLAVATVLGLVTFAYLLRVMIPPEFQLLSRTLWLKFVGFGLVVFGLGYAIFLVNADVWFTSASLGNRIAIAAALGVAIVLMSTLGWMSALLPTEQLRKSVFCLLITLLCIAGFLINNTLASFWRTAYGRQQEIIRDIRQNIPTLSPGSILILDGTCLEHGGAYIFTGGRDIAGVMIIAYHDKSLRATAILQEPKIGEQGVMIFTYRRETYYPYSEKLLLYNAGEKRVYQLTDATAARHYFQHSHFNPDEDCPPGFAWGWNAAPGTSYGLTSEKMVRAHVP